MKAINNGQECASLEYREASHFLIRQKLVIVLVKNSPQRLGKIYSPIFMEQLTSLSLILPLSVYNLRCTHPDNVYADQPMQHAIDLVHLILEHKPTACVAVAGYPDVHPQATSPHADLQYLQRKCQAGAAFVITQMCFSSATIRQFVDQCRDAGIDVPIVVGLYVPATFAALQTMCRVCRVPLNGRELAAFAEHAGDTDAEFQTFAVAQTRAMIDELLVAGIVGFQFFTMNRFDLVRSCVEGFGF